jgi:ammonium transporter, Amt family
MHRFHAVQGRVGAGSFWRFWLSLGVIAFVIWLTPITFGQATQAAATSAPAAAAAATTEPAAAAVSPVSSANTTDKADTGDTAWMLTSSAFVMLMMPGLALFYAGMVRRKNVLGTMMQSMAVLGIIGVEWVVIGYSMAFGTSHGGIVGWDPNLFLLKGVTPDMVHNATHTPELVFIMFQGMFAIITPALITGAFAERVKFSAYALFMLLWGIVIYNPLAHWVWGGGWLGAGTDGVHIRAIDFAGGTVVHISAGFSALVCAIYLGKRLGYPNNVLQPNSLVLTFLGAGLLWFGWFGFNGGSAVASNGQAAVAFSATQIAAAAAALAWMIAEWIKHGRPTTLGFASGLVAGLVAITPASGYVSPAGAIAIGIAAGMICYGAVLLKAKLGYDDSLDAFGVHGVGGFLGAILTGVFAMKVFGGVPGLVDGAPAQVGKQVVAAGAAAAFGVIGTLVLLVIVDKMVGFRVSREVEIEGMDAGIHGEQGWMLEGLPEASVEMPGSAVFPVARSEDRERTPVRM